MENRLSVRTRTNEIVSYGENGVPELIVRREHELVPVSQSDIDTYVADRLAKADSAMRPSLAHMAEDLPPVEGFPAFSTLLVDNDQNLWVEEYRRPGRERVVWTVFNPEGRVLGFAETPTGLEVFEIGDDYILGLTTDDLGIEYVQLWRLRRIP